MSTSKTSIRSQADDGAFTPLRPEALPCTAMAVPLIAGIETMHMIKKGQMRCPGGLALTHADHFYSLAVR